MANAVQNSIFQNAGIKRKDTLSDMYFGEKDDFGLTTDDANTSTNIPTPLADAYTKEQFSQKDSLFDFNLKDIDLGGVAALTKGIGSIWDAYNKKQYQDEIVGMEKERVNREVAKQAKAQSALEAAWA